MVLAANAGAIHAVHPVVAGRHLAMRVHGPAVDAFVLAAPSTSGPNGPGKPTVARCVAMYTLLPNRRLCYG